MIILLLNLVHFILLFSPIVIYFIPIKFMKYIKYIFKYGFLLLLLIPIHWMLLDNKCVFTLVTKYFGDMDDVETESGFSEKYLKWLYQPIMNIIGLEWNSNGLFKMVNLHWGINFFLLWYFLFFVGKCNLI